MQDAGQIERIQSFPQSAVLFGVLFVVFCVVAAVLIGSQPLTLSIVTIFAFAGVHNFMEFRYFLARIPLRWGRSKLFYSVGIGGVLVLTTAYLLIYLSTGWLWSLETWSVVSSTWNTAFILWVGLLFYLRGKQRPQTDWSWAFAVGFLAAALAWLAPSYWAISLVYLHPFIAMYFLERQLRRTKREWVSTYRICLATIPLFVFGLWLIYGSAPPLSEDTYLFSVITNHAGANIFPQISSHFLVATHVFLETIHYAVWIIMIPLIDQRAVPWKLSQVPIISGNGGFPKLATAALAFSALLVIGFWVGFSVDYVVARDIYFAFAIAHVLAEFPFLIKML
jgi:hypothetical protein